MLNSTEHTLRIRHKFFFVSCSIYFHRFAQVCSICNRRLLTIRFIFGDKIWRNAHVMMSCICKALVPIINLIIAIGSTSHCNLANRYQQKMRFISLAAASSCNACSVGTHKRTRQYTSEGENEKVCLLEALTTVSHGPNILPRRVSEPLPQPHKPLTKKQ